ncbi:winged helix-turn-helix transcriptional regulator [Cohnella zeiphila]|uniref:Helix-turn-helix transcriptional regulator n=1 Tax=Cohnella zeiphila TaxID=2761120 RepID=A0A7X0W025_9BACL|nr:helix-turn-helix domain-containing protein [Cohnella zeiphila]MBB6734603.1 helix-turn-helix transcriptional regulator [Cohnella zeiphila]
MSKLYNCPVEVTLDAIGGKWKTVILRYLSKQTLRYSQLQRRMPNITQRMLTLQLKELEADGLIRRTVYDEAVKRVEYSLTDSGKTVEPILELMCEWGKRRAREFALKVASGESWSGGVPRDPERACEQ